MGSLTYRKELFEVPTPSYVIAKDLLEHNLRILHEVEESTGAHVLLAQKCFSMYHYYPLIAQYLSGTTASGLYEAKLGHEEMGKENHVFSPAYKESEFAELTKICDHIIFNSFAQWKKFGPEALAAGVSCGLRINPEHSTQDHAIYDPCSPLSRLGARLSELDEDSLEGLSGFHFHTLCEQGAEPLAETLEAVEEKFGRFLPRLKWINFGGGHHITREGYNMPLLERCIRRMQDRYGLKVYLEPGEAIALDAGFLAATVLEVIEGPERELPVAVLDVSAACHMPDVLEMPYRPPLSDSGEAGERKYSYMLAGATWLAGDNIGVFSFDEPLKPGQKLLFGDMAIYTMVKNNTFNGMPLPDIVYVDAGGSWKTIRTFGYDDFKQRL